MSNVYQLRFNGKPLTDRVGITALSVSTPRVDFRTCDIPDRRGDIRAGRKFGNRTISISLVVLGSSIEDNVDIIRELTEWCMSDEPAEMFLPGMDSDYILCECETYPVLDYCRADEDIQITFKAHDPSFVRADQSSSAVGTSFTVGGTLPVYPVITQHIDRTYTNAAWTLDGITTMSLDSVDAGDLVIDCAHERVTLDGLDITEKVPLTSTVGLLLEPGEHTITGQNGAAGTVTWHEARLWGE